MLKSGGEGAGGQEFGNRPNSHIVFSSAEKSRESSPVFPSLSQSWLFWTFDITAVFISGVAFNPHFSEQHEKRSLHGEHEYDSSLLFLFPHSAEEQETSGVFFFFFAW